MTVRESFLVVTDSDGIDGMASAIPFYCWLRGDSGAVFAVFLIIMY